MKWRKARYGERGRVHTHFKIERDLKAPLMEYADDQDVTSSDVVNTLLHQHKPLRAYLSKGKHGNKDSSESETSSKD